MTRSAYLSGYMFKQAVYERPAKQLDPKTDTMISSRGQYQAPGVAKPVDISVERLMGNKALREQFFKDVRGGKYEVENLPGFTPGMTNDQMLHQMTSTGWKFSPVPSQESRQKFNTQMTGIYQGPAAQYGATMPPAPEPYFEARTTDVPEWGREPARPDIAYPAQRPVPTKGPLMGSAPNVYTTPSSAPPQTQSNPPATSSAPSSRSPKVWRNDAPFTMGPQPYIMDFSHWTGPHGRWGLGFLH